MPPATPHWVLGTSNAICVGRHFYNSSSIRSSVVGIVHTFLLDGAVTNANHVTTRTVLYQLMVFWSTRLDKTDVDGGFYRTNSIQILIYHWHRGSYTRVIIRGRVFRYHIPWDIHHVIPCFRCT